jgi:hypothetical protein
LRERVKELEEEGNKELYNIIERRKKKQGG